MFKYKSFLNMNPNASLRYGSQILLHSSNNFVYKDLQINGLRLISSAIGQNKTKTATTTSSSTTINRYFTSDPKSLSVFRNSTPATTRCDLKLQINNNNHHAQSMKYGRNFSTLLKNAVGEKIATSLSLSSQIEGKIMTNVQRNPYSCSAIRFNLSRDISFSSKGCSCSPSSSSFSSSTQHHPAAATNSAENNFTAEFVRKDSMVIIRSDKGDETRHLPLIWLRDHCLCDSCYNHETSQKEFLINPMEQDLGVEDVCVDYNQLVIQWNDGHRSCWNMDWLLQHSFHKQTRAPAQRILWNKKTIQEEKSLPTVTFQEHMETKEGRLQTMKNIIQYGFSFVTDAPVSMDGTQEVVERIVPIQDTFFDDGMWTFTADGFYSDTAWTNTYIGPHTDNTYMEIPAGFQVFHCLHHDGRGGETLLVDGFRVIETLKHSHPDAVRFLSSHLVPHEYKEPPMNNRPGFHLHTLSTIMKLHPATGEPIHFRFNPYDRAPLDTIPTENVPEFYQFYHQLSTEVRRPENEFRVKLNPGTVLFIDNWRLMHGRASFDGNRVMCGCYTRRDDWMSSVRTLGLVSTTH